MATTAYSVRIPDDLKRAVDRAVRDQTVHSFSEAVNAALEEWTGRPGCVTCATAAMAAREAQARLAEARGELRRVTAELARLTGAPVVPDGRYAGAVTEERALAAYLAGATAGVPATPKGASVMSGYAHDYTQVILTAMTRLGYLDRPGKGRYVPVPGADMAEGVREARKAASAASTARMAAARADGPSPSPAPPAPPAARTAPSGVKSAATGNGGIARARERAAAVGAPLVAASDLPRPGTVKFLQPEPGAEPVVTAEVPEVPDHGGKRGRPAPAPAAAACPPHPRKRVIKGFCYACGRQVPDDERIK